jgi:hypothetical protein
MWAERLKSAKIRKRTREQSPFEEEDAGGLWERWKEYLSDQG